MPPNKSRKKKFRDPFFDDDSTKRRKVAADEDQDAEIDSESDEDGVISSGDESEQESEKETVDEARKRIAEDYLRKFRESAKKEKEQRDEEGEGSDDEDDEGARDSLLAQKMIKEQQEESGRIRKNIASRSELELQFHTLFINFICLRFDLNVTLLV